MSTNIKTKITLGSNLYDKQHSASQHFSVVNCTCKAHVAVYIQRFASNCISQDGLPAVFLFMT